MREKTLTITNSIPLPKEARLRWKDQDAVMRVFDDTIIIKRVMYPAWDVIIPKLRRAGKKITPATVKAAVSTARKAG